MKSQFDDSNAFDAEKIREMQAAFASLFIEMETYVSLINETLGQLPISPLQSTRGLDPRPQLDRLPKEREVPPESSQA